MAENREQTIRIRYHSNEIDHLTYVDGKSDWIDLRAAKEYRLKAGEFALIDLGVSVKLPEGYEMITAPRSSTFKNYGLIQSNGIGVVDESYCGDGDVLKMPVYATRDTVVHASSGFRSISPESCLRKCRPLEVLTAADSEAQDCSDAGHQEELEKKI